ncbi:bifunctional proline dehydrogenase/L-glutamate gamma-semialdehyde dehydrogenase [Sulfurospirillum multivorans]|uniref:L-glutamate gamma-semialdehyde dehydrogenase n=2 Tax=Sulfurospirillum multivorans TaxID=66821 RepID=A0AA86AK45_SULMK|nr:bifunctional proline dehydrogenase/L-glutamate gamma-semialdehyde dehydrogenase [Sulfurospirillum multivorans]AHJ11749.1 proline dehydrogenase (proline oxidase) / delta-1-pyrroline-5-carboxylate dehydrogenase [Sulfurospirillum multivorans DSM 12446]QEH05255.1 proline dehydrogenase (proline oxidase) / delta-1-pyrroline-5-carboxylate dehydrogenase [Sulfurospirillum multivorans]
MLKNEIIIERAIALAEKWQNRATELVSDFDKKFHIKMNKMLSHPKDKVFLIELMDQSFRSKNPARVANQIEYLFAKYEMASFFTTSERFLVFLFRNAGIYLPQISIPLFISNIREDTKTVVLKGEDDVLNAHLIKRKREGTRINLNLIGEVVLGEEEAEERIEKYLKVLENPNVDYISIKISTLFSQINALAYEETVEELVKRLSRIYAQAKKYSFTNAKGEQTNKFINLDMEEYRDLGLTFSAFTQTLDLPEFQDFRAGIVLQAYLPDSHLWQQKLIAWAKQRVEKGGVPIKMRLVKGANMEMEETEAGLRHWELVTHTRKIDTDSNYKVMGEFALRPEHAQYVNLGMASHNLFELAHGYELSREYGTTEFFSMEMLEGMSESARLAIKEISGEVILYAPTAKKEQFTNAIAYLVRRLDENTGEENFIRYSFGLTVGSPAWESQKQKFIDAFENTQNLFIGAKRNQNRLSEQWENYEGGSFFRGEYHGEADTDFILPPNKEWAKTIRAKWQKKVGDEVGIAPIVVGGEAIVDRDIKTVIDKSQLKEGVVCGKYALATKEDLQKAVEIATKDVDGWRNLSASERQKVLGQVANKMRAKRGDLIGVAAAEVGKVFFETDVEVSEAIDFLEFYGYSARYFEEFKNLTCKGKGVGVVTPPWNFPIAIPVGGISAALAAGNCVIIKPASAAALCAYELCQCFWEAGVSKNILQFVPCAGSLAGEYLVQNEKVDFVILTGGEETAYTMLKSRPNLFLSAETGGKDATIVTAMSDREQAIKNVVHSAFSNSGQKCSATSLLVLEEEVYNDPHFKKGLVDAAQSLHVGSVWDFANRLGTLANSVSGALKQALESLEEGESWALAPMYADENEYMLKPSIKWGVKEGSFCHKTELFGPVLSVMCAKDLKHAIAIVNATGYGLTSGIESLDEREVAYWRKHLKAGNLYINRGTTGAIVLRQPFGGFGKSAVGSGRKAGIHNYITQFMEIEDVAEPLLKHSPPHAFIHLIHGWKDGCDKGLYAGFKADFEKLSLAVGSYVENVEVTFSQEQDFAKVRGEDNLFKYLPLKRIALRVSQDDGLFDVMSRIMASIIAQTSLHVSIDFGAQSSVISFLYENQGMLFGKNDTIEREDEATFVKCFETTDKIFYANAARISPFVYEAAAKKAKCIVRAKPLMEGRVELLHYFAEQSISHSYHRYGNLGARGIKK